MKKSFLIAGLCLFSVLVLSYGLTKHVVKPITADKNQSISQTQYKQEYPYYIGDYKGNLAVFKATESKPIKVFDVYTSSLPENDYKMIINRIGVKNEDELELLIEEYTS